MKKIRLSALVLSILILLISVLPFTVSAEESSETENETIAQDPGIISGNAIVSYCIDDKQILYSNRLDEKVAPAVATKLVTCMVVSDLITETNGKSDRIKVTVTAKALEYSGSIVDARLPKMGFKAGDTYTAKDLISATLVANANDAAAALAAHFGENYLGGSIGDFVDRMNAKVSELGLTNTHFTNPTGLDDADQYSTPREIALIAAAFYGYNDLVSLSDVESFYFNDTTTVRSKNFLKSGYYVKGFTNKQAIGIIAGQKDLEGDYCLIAASQKDGRTYIFVVMCAGGMIVERDPETDVISYSFGIGNAYTDMHKLMNWTRESFEFLSVAGVDTIIGELRVNLGSSADHVMIVPEENVDRLVIKSSNGSVAYNITYDESVVYKKEFNGVEYDTMNAPVVSGQVVGTVTFSYNGTEIATVNAVAKESVESDSIKAFLDRAKQVLFGEQARWDEHKDRSNVLNFLLISPVGNVLGVIAVLFVVYIIYKIVSAGIFVSSKMSGKNAKTTTAKKDSSVKKTSSQKQNKQSKNIDDNASTKEMRDL